MGDDDRNWLESLDEIFAAGRRVVEDLYDQNVQLRRRIAELEAKLTLAHQPSEKEPETLEDPEPRASSLGEDSQSTPAARLYQLETQYTELMQEYADLERQNSNYLSLYVASSQIHATLVFEEVLRNIQEIIINLIGADVFSIYLYDESGRQLRRAASEGEVDPADEVLAFGDNLLSRVVRSGSLCLDIKEADLPSGQQPIAILPLTIGSQPIGVVVLFKLLVQKQDFDAFDMELFDLLSAHAATALMSSSKYRQLERKTQTLQGLLDLFKTGSVPGTVERVR